MEEDINNYISPIVTKELLKVRKRVLTKDRDFVAVYDGEEGVGKSVLAMQHAKLLDPEFNLDKVVFTADEFINIIRDPKTKKGSAIVLDEAFSSANSRASLTEVNRSMVAVATEMRQRNLFVLLVLPSFFDLDRYFALWRCRALFHLYFTPQDDRRYILFTKDQKKMLYLYGKKFYNYNKPHSSFPPFNFPNYYTVDEQEYRLKKSKAFQERPVSRRAEGWLLQRNAYMKFLANVLQLNNHFISKIPTLYGINKLSPNGTRDAINTPTSIRPNLTVLAPNMPKFDDLPTTDGDLATTKVR